MVGCTEQKRAAVGHVAVNGINAGVSEGCITLNCIPRCQRTAAENSDVVVDGSCGGKLCPVLHGESGIAVFNT